MFNLNLRSYCVCNVVHVVLQGFQPLFPFGFPVISEVEVWIRQEIGYCYVAE